MLRLLFILLLFVCINANTMHASNTEVVSDLVQVNQVKQDTLLVGIQSKIYDAFVMSLMSNNNNSLSKLRNELENLNKVKKLNLIDYWRSYLQFYSSIFYLKVGDTKTAELEIDKGIYLLEEMKNKNSEDYALLAMLQSFGIQFKGKNAMVISGEIKKNAKQSIAMDSKNLRAYYVLASIDFYTPENYGGGKEAEEYLLKAISLPIQKVKNEYLPSWGKEESYEMIIKLYIKKERWDLAKKYIQKGIADYPESYTINQLATKIVGK